MPLDPSRELHSLNFDQPHGVAITAPFTGYGANQMDTATLFIKSQNSGDFIEVSKNLRQIRVELSFEEFLQRFFGMYWDDAEHLARLLGFEIDGEEYLSQEYMDYLDQEIEHMTVLRKTKTEEEFYKLTQAEQEGLFQLQVKFEEVTSSEFVSEEKLKNVKKSYRAFVKSKEATEMSEDKNKELQAKIDKIEFENSILKSGIDQESAAVVIKAFSDRDFAEVIDLIQSLKSKVSASEDEISELRKAKEELDSLKEKMGVDTGEAFESKMLEKMANAALITTEDIIASKDENPYMKALQKEIDSVSEEKQ